MPFFKPAKYFRKLDCVSLQVHKPRKDKINPYNCRKRAFLFTSHGSVTIEASIVIVIFMMAILFIINFLLIVNTELELQISINNIVKSVAKDKFYIELADELTDYNSDISNIKNKMKEWMKQSGEDSDLEENISKTINISYLMVELAKDKKEEKFADSNIVGGIAGINISKSSVEDGFVDMVLEYKIKVPFINKSFEIEQRAFVKDWTGCDITKKQEIVYLTKSGNVYHKTKNCKYLNLNITKTVYESVETLRNNNGGKYKSCEYCENQALHTGSFVYITDDGNRYHSKIECQSLTREIIAVDISKVQGKEPCSNCGQGE